MTTTTGCPLCHDPDLSVVFSHSCADDTRQDRRHRDVALPASPNARRSTDTSSRSTGHGGNGPAATDAQVRYLVRLGMDAAAARRLGKRAASDEIAERQARQAAAPAPTPDRRPNRYAGPCVRCGADVPAEAGWLVKDSAGRWAADHRGDCPTRPAPAAPQPVVQPQLPGADVVPAGSYAIDGTGSAANDVVFYEVDRPTEGRWAGRVFVALVVGGRESRNVRHDQVAGILARIVAAGPQAAMARYGHEIGCCGVCHRHLTDDESRARGIGPVCAANLGW